MTKKRARIRSTNDKPREQGKLELPKNQNTAALEQTVKPRTLSRLKRQGIESVREKINNIRVLIVLAAPAIFLCYRIYSTFVSDNHTQQLDWVINAQSLAIGINVMLLSYIVINRAIPNSSVEARKSTAFASAVLGIITTFYLNFLQYDYLILFSKYLKSVFFSFFSDWLNYIFGNIISWAISGVVGNLFYDVMLKILKGKGEDEHKKID
ncbi:MAG: hypothetical protein AABZ00_08995 [Chloroflexota bacterium]